MPGPVCQTRTGNASSSASPAGHRRHGTPRSPVPRYDLLRLDKYASMPVQFSRGCPYSCEFCDIVVMNGRVPRTKAPAQVVEELEALRRRGWRDMVVIVDGDFIGNRKRGT